MTGPASHLPLPNRASSSREAAIDPDTTDFWDESGECSQSWAQCSEEKDGRLTRFTM